MPEQIIGSPNQNIMVVNNSGAVPIAAYSGGTVYPLQVDSTGRLITTTSLTLGSLVIGSVSANVDSIYVQSGANIDLGSAWTTVGSVYVTNTVPVSGTFSVSSVYLASGADIGSVYLKDGAYISVIPSGTFYTTMCASGTTGIPVSGLVKAEQFTVPWDVTGSVAISTSPIPISGVITVEGLATAGSLGTQNISGLISVESTDLDIRDLSSTSDSISSVQGTDPWIILGSVNIDNTSIIGSLGIQTVDGTISANVNNASTIGSYTTQNVNVTTASTIPVSGEMGRGWALSNATDSVMIGDTITLPISGAITVDNLAIAGSLAIQTVDGTINANQGTTPWLITGSVDVSPTIGSPCFKQSTTTTTSTYAEVWGDIGIGSKIEMHGYHISTNLPGIVTIVGSGTTVSNIAKYYLNYGSGACIEKTFCSPITPIGADIPLGFQTTVAGSTSVTIYGREVK